MCSFCSRDAACRLSRPSPDGADSPTRRMARWPCLHRRRGLRHCIRGPTNGGESRLRTTCAEHYASSNTYSTLAAERRVAVTHTSNTGVNADAAPADRLHVAAREAHRPPRTARARCLSAARRRRALGRPSFPPATSERGRSPTTTLAHRTPRLRRAGTHCVA